MGCAEFLVKYILFFFNLVFVLVGIALIALGVAILVQLKDVADLFPSGVVDSVPTFIIVLGSVVFFIAFFGCCGAIQESRCLLVMYSVCMVILAAAKICVTVILYRNLENVHEIVDKWLQSLFDGDNLKLHAIEDFLSCCGVTSADDYTAQNQPVPPTCCSFPVDYTCTGDTFSGCSTRLENYLNYFGDAFGPVLITVIIVELVAMIFSLFLHHTITRKEQQKAVYH